MTIVVQCGSCKKKIKAAEKFAGKRVKCPGCQHVLSIPSLAVEAEEIPIRQEDLPPIAASSPLSDMLDDEIPVRQEQPTQAAPHSTDSCPECGTAIATAGAVMCVSCGYDFRTQTRQGSEVGAAPPTGGKSRKRSSSGERSRSVQILRGCGLSAVSAAIGAVVWYLICLVSGFEVGIIAWLLGGAAGIGMAVGCGEDGTSAFTGFLAAVIAFFGIFAARMAIVLTILIPMIAAEVENLGDEIALEEGFDDEMADGDFGIDDEPLAEGEESEELTPEEKAAFEEEMAEAFAEDEIDFEEGPEAGIGLGFIFIALFAFFGMLMFGGIWQAIFVLLACATAFKVGWTGVMDDD